jgi:3-hydroxybutyryl-CoA dehydrogenase
MDTTNPRVGVIGGGTMGAGIAICAVRVGLDTVLHEVDETRAEEAKARIDRFLRRSVERGKLTDDQHGTAMACLRTSVELDDQSDRDLVIEAIFEDLGAKQDLFGRLDDITGANAVFATNTSTLSVTEIAAGSRYPGRVVGMHFCNPAPMMPLVEVVRGYLTSDATVDDAMRVTRLLGKEHVLVRDTPGFLVNRFLIPFENDCIRALDNGVASVPEIDLAVTAGLGYPMGPFTLLDTVGLDVHRAVSMSLFRQLKDPRYAPPSLVDRMIAAGHLGRKSGRGFYQYDTAGMFGT